MMNVLLGGLHCRLDVGLHADWLIHEHVTSDLEKQPCWQRGGQRNDLVQWEFDDIKTDSGVEVSRSRPHDEDRSNSDISSIDRADQTRRKWIQLQ